MTLRFGVNYIPSQGWLYSWTDWQAAAVRRDLAAIADLGMDHVRVHCIWPVFQPNPSLVSAAALGRLRELADIAGDLGLDVYVCVLNGWMSGTYFRPFWQTDEMSVFTDPRAIRAERELCDAVAGALAGHPAFRGMDIGNEPNVMSIFAANAVTRAEGDAWLRTLLAQCEQSAPGLFHVAGVDHAPWMTDDSPFGREALATLGSASVIHSWVFFTGALRRYGIDGTGTRHLARYLIELARAHAETADRPVWLQEIGVSSEWVPEERLPSFASTILDNAVLARPWAITWWCSHDIDPALSGFASLEYGLGLLTTNNVQKPVGIAVKEAIERHRAAGGAPSASAERPVLVLPEGVTPGLDFIDRYVELIDVGADPVIELERRTGDEER